MPRITILHGILLDLFVSQLIDKYHSKIYDKNLPIYYSNF